MSTENRAVAAKIYVAGHNGMVGSALVRRLTERGYANLLTRDRAQLDLTDQRAVHEYLRAKRPDYIFMAAAKVGGIHANDTLRAEFLYQNLLIEANLIEAAYRAGVSQLLFLGSSCIYPRDCPQPIREEYLLTGPLEATNEPYAIAKIAGIKLCENYNRQYGTRYVAAMPTNLYGPNDNYDPLGSHVLPALIRKAHIAKTTGANELVVWGSGSPRREFLYVDDLADACIFLMEQSFRENTTPRIDGGLINIGCGADLTIRELAELVMQAVGYQGKLAFDASKPDGTPRKLLDTERMTRLGWRPATTLPEGIALTYRDFLERTVNGSL
jgi:GDP-L-fucose synthase